MEATRTRFAAMVEWLLAAAFIAVLLAAGSVIVREFSTVSTVMPVIARESEIPLSPTPASVPSRAVSVPVLLLSDGKEVRVGDTMSQIAARLGRQAEVGTQSVERSPGGERLTRVYEHAGTDFILVFEPFAPKAEPRVAAIYLQ